MSITANQHYAVALQKIEETSCEVTRRQAASSCYYSFFHFANGYANTVASVPPSVLSGSTHQNLSEFYGRGAIAKNMSSSHYRQIGILLRQSHKVRCDADYKIQEDFEEFKLQQHHAACDKGIGILKQYVS